jgi:hypothetical protein
VKLFAISCEGIATTFFKAEDRNHALERWMEGMSDSTIRKYSSDPTFKTEEVKSIDQLLEMVPEEFKIDPDAGF